MKKELFKTYLEMVILFVVMLGICIYFANITGLIVATTVGALHTIIMTNRFLNELEA